MLKTILVVVAAASLVGAVAPVGYAAQQDRDRVGTEAQDRDRIYGSQLMNEAERAQYQDRMRSAKTEQERERIRAEHHERMKARAKERGVSLPDDPPAARGGPGYGPGTGPGMGPGMGSGGRGGR